MSLGGPIFSTFIEIKKCGIEEIRCSFAAVKSWQKIDTLFD